MTYNVFSGTLNLTQLQLHVYIPQSPADHTLDYEVTWDTFTFKFVHDLCITHCKTLLL